MQNLFMAVEEDMFYHKNKNITPNPPLFILLFRVISFSFYSLS